MPTYEYRCSDCGHAFDLFQRMSDVPGAECGECGGRAERLISGGAGLLFKGEGFYITDYRSESYKKAEREGAGEGAAERGGAAAGDGGGGNEKGEAKAAKPDAGAAGSAPAERDDRSPKPAGPPARVERSAPGRTRRRGSESGGSAGASPGAKRAGQGE